MHRESFGRWRTKGQSTYRLARGARPGGKRRARRSASLLESLESRALLAVAGNLAITEINYNPPDPTTAESAQGAASGSEFEFIEMQNVGTEPIDLAGIRFDMGIVFTRVGGLTLNPGEFAVLAANPASLAIRYGAVANVMGPYTGSLSNSGETLRLLDAGLGVIQEFTYDDATPWPTRADGAGATLVVADTAGDYSDSDNWNSSEDYLGSPGTVGTAPVADVIINEILSASTLPAVDAVELVNVTAQPIDIGGWYLSDSSNNFKKFRIPDGTLINPGEYLVYDESDFNVPLDPNAFSLSSSGDSIWLMEADDTGRLTRFVDDATFEAAAPDVPFGNYPNITGRLYPLAALTLGGPNSGPFIGPVVISELMYNPLGGNGANDLEFVELTNITGSPVDIGGWKFDSGIDFTFAAGTTIPALSSVVLASFDPAAPANAARLFAFQSAYGTAYTLLGGYSPQPPANPSSLSDGGETVRLVRPGVAVPPESPPPILVDEVRYKDSPPWPVTPDGAGPSLTRLSSGVYGNEPTNWTGAAASPGKFLPRVEARWVFYNNSAWDGNSAAANANDDQAIATDKVALLPGQTATFVNYTNYSKGINGIMIDVQSLSGAPTLADFTFKTGNNNTPSAWAALGTAPSLLVRPGAGQGGSTRLTLTWPDGAIAKCWLQVTVRASATTGLLANDVFYFGNAVGEAGNSVSDAQVNAGDELAARVNPRNLGNLAPITFRYDYNRDKQVNATDQIIARTNGTNIASSLKFIMPAPAAGAPALAGLAGDDLLVGAADGAADDELADSIARRRRRA